VYGALHLHTAPAGEGSIRVVTETWGSIDDLPDAVCLKNLVGEGLTLRRE
jgi:hypothetical protein